MLCHAILCYAMLCHRDGGSAMLGSKQDFGAVVQHSIQALYSSRGGVDSGRECAGCAGL